MNNIVIPFIGLVFLCCNGLKDYESKQPLDQSIEIKEAIVRVNEDSVKMKRCDFFKESSEGGEIMGYYEQGALKRIELNIFSELGKQHKEFKNQVGLNSFDFKQTYFFYDKPFYENGFKIVDSVVIEGSVKEGSIAYKNIIGRRISVDDINKVLSDLHVDREKYTNFLSTCLEK